MSLNEKIPVSELNGPYPMDDPALVLNIHWLLLRII
ncbi:protein of unknown function [Burkholderia multivorans]